jgi:hypothetical protein
MTVDQNFLAQLTHPAHRRLYEHWCRRTPPGRLPGRQHLDFEDINDLRPWIGEVEVVRDQARLFFRHRRAGKKLTSKTRRDPSGLWFEETYEGHTLTETRLAHVQIVATKRPELTCFSQPISPEQELQDDRLILPLATDGQIVDVLIYLSIFLPD